MKHDVFAKWLKAVIAGATLIGIACCVFVIPIVSSIMSVRYPLLAEWMPFWAGVLYICALPCFAAMILSWRIASNIQKDNGFSMENARLFGIFSYLALGDSAFFLISCIIFWIIGFDHIGLLLVNILIVFIGMAVFVCTSALSYLVAKAASLQEDSDLTI